MLQLDSSSPQSAINNSRNNTPRQQANSTKPPKKKTNYETKKNPLMKTDRCNFFCTNKHESISSFVRGESADKWFRNLPDASNPSNANCCYSTHYYHQAKRRRRRYPQKLCFVVLLRPRRRVSSSSIVVQ